MTELLDVATCIVAGIGGVWISQAQQAKGLKLAHTGLLILAFSTIVWAINQTLHTVIEMTV
jgi:hypothetical protein